MGLNVSSDERYLVVQIVMQTVSSLGSVLIWWLTNKEEKYKDLKVGIFDDDLRWNNITFLTGRGQNLRQDQ